MSYATVPLVSCTWSVSPSPTSHSTSTASPASSSARVGTSATRATPCSAESVTTRKGPPRAVTRTRASLVRATVKEQASVRVDVVAMVVPAPLGVDVRRHRTGVGRDQVAVRCRATMARTQSSSRRDRVRVVPGEGDHRPAVAGRAGRRERIRSTSTPTYGARSVLLTTSRSARSMPGPPLRATSPPPATSSTKIWTSTSAGEKVAVRLSPPDSTSTRSSGRELAPRGPRRPAGWR